MVKFGVQPRQSPSGTNQSSENFRLNSQYPDQYCKTGFPNEIYRSYDMR